MDIGPSHRLAATAVLLGPGTGRLASKGVDEFVLRELFRDRLLDIPRGRDTDGTGHGGEGLAGRALGLLAVEAKTTVLVELNESHSVSCCTIGKQKNSWSCPG